VLYWALVAAYAGLAAAAAGLASAHRRLVLVGVAVIGILVAVPLRCVTLPFFLCRFDEAPVEGLAGECRLDDTADCTTALGVAVPLHLRAGWSLLVGLVIVAATVCLAAAVPSLLRRRRGVTAGEGVDAP
jgi:hypothetical protein